MRIVISDHKGERGGHFTGMKVSWVVFGFWFRSRRISANDWSRLGWCASARPPETRPNPTGSRNRNTRRVCECVVLVCVCVDELVYALLFLSFNMLPRAAGWNIGRIIIMIIKPTVSVWCFQGVFACCSGADERDVFYFQPNQATNMWNLLFITIIIIAITEPNGSHFFARQRSKSDWNWMQCVHLTGTTCSPTRKCAVSWPNIGEDAHGWIHIMYMVHMVHAISVICDLRCSAKSLLAHAQISWRVHLVIGIMRYNVSIYLTQSLLRATLRARNRWARQPWTETPCTFATRAVHVVFDYYFFYIC